MFTIRRERYHQYHCLDTVCHSGSCKWCEFSVTLAWSHNGVRRFEEVYMCRCPFLVCDHYANTARSVLLSISAGTFLYIGAALCRMTSEEKTTWSWNKVVCDWQISKFKPKGKEDKPNFSLACRLGRDNARCPATLASDHHGSNGADVSAMAKRVNDGSRGKLNWLHIYTIVWWCGMSTCSFISPPDATCVDIWHTDATDVLVTVAFNLVIHLPSDGLQPRRVSLVLQ